MSEEEIRKITKEYAEMYFTKGIDSTKIFKYVDELEKKVEQLENIRKEIKKEIKKYAYTDNFGDTVVLAKYIEDILNKGDNNGK